MKRKSFSPVHDTVSEQPIKPELKKVKGNEHDENSHEMAPSYVKDSASKKPNGNNFGISSSVDRFLTSLTKADQNVFNNNNSKAKLTNGDTSPICKNLNTTYGDLSDFSEKREPFQELTQLKLARKLAKLNKIDDTNPVQDLDFNEKISKKLELMVLGAQDADPQKRFTSSKKSESLRKALQSVKSTKTKEGLFEVVEDEQHPGFNLGETNHTELTPQTAAPGCISPDFFRVLTAQDILQDITENKEAPEQQENPQPEIITTAFTVESPQKKQPERSNSLQVEEERSTSRLSSNQNSSKDINKRRQSFSVRDVNSKSKAFQAFSSSMKNPSSNAANNPSIKVTPPSAHKRSSTVPKPTATQVAADRRKSVHVPNNANNGGTDSGNKTKPSRKSCAPENLMNLTETVEENKLLKKEMKRKNKEIENLKREKLALVRKLKAIDPELAGEGKEDAPLQERVSRVYCRVRPLEDNNSGSVVNYPEVDSMKSPSRGVIPEVSALKCIELNNHQARKSDFYFDRVFSQSATQSEVFEELLPFVQSAVQGNSSVCIISLGSEGSGKEYTIQGSRKDAGLMPRAAENLLSKFEMGRTESGYLRLEFGCMKIVGEKVVDILCQADRKQETSNDDSAMQLEENYTLPGIPVALNNTMWKQIGGIQDLYRYLDLISKTTTNESVGEELSFLIFVFKVIHGNGKHNLIQFVEVDVSNVLDAQSNQSPMKSKNKAIPDFFANLQKLSPDTKEIALLYNINPSADNYLQSKELLDSSLKFTNSVKPLSSYI